MRKAIGALAGVMAASGVATAGIVWVLSVVTPTTGPQRPLNWGGIVLLFFLLMNLGMLVIGGFMMRWLSVHLQSVFPSVLELVQLGREDRDVFRKLRGLHIQVAKHEAEKLVEKAKVAAVEVIETAKTAATQITPTGDSGAKLR